MRDAHHPANFIHRRRSSVNEDINIKSSILDHQTSLKCIHTRQVIGFNDRIRRITRQVNERLMRLEEIKDPFKPKQYYIETTDKTQVPERSSSSDSATAKAIKPSPARVISMLKSHSQTNFNKKPKHHGLKN